MTAPALTLTDLTTLEDDPALLAATYERVLRPSFTLDELPGPEGVQPNGGHVLTVARDASGEPVGAAFCELDPDGVSLLEYLAVSPASRGLGAGGALLAHLRELWQARGCGLVLAEVHDPRGHAEDTDEHPEARLRFYGRAGAEVLDAPWVQPALGPRGERVPDMLLLVMHRPADADADAEPTVPSAPVLAWARDYFEVCEGDAPTDAAQDPRGVALLDRIGAAPALRVLPLARWREVAPLALD